MFEPKPNLGRLFFVAMLSCMIVFVMSACKKEQRHDMSLIPIEKQTLEGKQAFLRKNCLHIAKNILLLSREKNFRKLIYSEVEKNFDTESYVLIDALVNSPYQDILKQMGIEVVCNKFKN